MSEAELELKQSLARVRHAISIGRKRIVISALVGGMLLTVAAFLVPRSYVARVLLLPIEGSTPASLRGVASGLAELYMGSAGGGDLTRALPDIVQSRSYLDRLLSTAIDDEESHKQLLIDLLSPRGLGEARIANGARRLSKQVHVVLDRRTGTITLRARFNNPDHAAILANVAAALLQETLNDLFAGKASQERRFLEERIAETQDRLRESEERLSLFRQRNVRMGRSPRLLLEENRLARAVREQETVYLTLRDQYELARISETRRVPSIQIVDPAKPPLHHDWPPRKLFALAGLLLGGLIGILTTVSQPRVQSRPRSASESPAGA